MVSLQRQMNLVILNCEDENRKKCPAEWWAISRHLYSFDYELNLAVDYQATFIIH